MGFPYLNRSFSAILSVPTPEQAPEVLIGGCLERGILNKASTWNGKLVAEVYKQARQPHDAKGELRLAFIKTKETYLKFLLEIQELDQQFRTEYGKNPLSPEMKGVRQRIISCASSLSVLFGARVSVSLQEVMQRIDSVFEVVLQEQIVKSAHIECLSQF